MNRYLERYSGNWSKASIRLIHTPASTIKKTFFYIQETGYFETTPPYFTERANLDSFLMILTLSGHGRLRYQNAEYLLNAGDICWIHCMHHHYYECLPDSQWDFLWFHFHGMGSQGYYQTFRGNTQPVLTLTEYQDLADTIRTIITLVQNRSYTSDLRISGLLNQILLNLILVSGRRQRAPEPTPAHISSVIKELEKHFLENISLDQLSKQFGISKFYLLRQFKQYTGLPIGEYRITLRINYAKELLKYSDLTISEIAAACSITGVSHFIRLFKAREGKTPLEFRKEWR